MVDSSERVALCAQLACIWEATARKPGNVHRHCDFEDATYLDFLLSAAAIAPLLADAGRRSLAAHPYPLIARKRGLAEAQAASRRARHVLQAGWPGSPAGGASLAELDRWLRAEGHSRNPGTTADLVTACLFILLRQGTIR